MLLPCRHLSIHEHNSLDLMNSYGVTVPKGEVARTSIQAKAIANKLGKKNEYEDQLSLHLCLHGNSVCNGGYIR